MLPANYDVVMYVLFLSSSSISVSTSFSFGFKCIVRLRDNFDGLGTECFVRFLGYWHCLDVVIRRGDLRGAGFVSSRRLLIFRS